MNEYIKNWIRVAKGIGIMVIMFPVGIFTALKDGILGTEEFVFTVKPKEK